MLRRIKIAILSELLWVKVRRLLPSFVESTLVMYALGILTRSHDLMLTPV